MNPENHQTDEEIVIEVQNGGVDSFGVLVDRYEQKLLRYAKKFLLEREDAKDLVQNVFIKSYSNIQGFNPSRKFSPWIYRIAHNEFINAIKSRKNKETVSIFDFDILFPHLASKESAEEELNREDVKKTIGQSLDKLNVKYREPIVLYYFEDLDYKEIADILQIPVSTVGVRLKRGKTLLKKIFEESDKKL